MTVLWWSVWVAAAGMIGQGWHLRNTKPHEAAGCFIMAVVCVINLIVVLWLNA